MDRDHVIFSPENTLGSSTGSWKMLLMADHRSVGRGRVREVENEQLVIDKQEVRLVAVMCLPATGFV